MWDYPRPPALVPSPRRLRIELGGVTIADSVAALRVLETSHPPTFYVPPGDIAEGALRPAGGRSFCEWKGDAHYFDVVGAGHVEPRAAWAYAAPVARYAALRDHVAFYPSRMDACWLDDERVLSQEGDFYGGWITADLEGPFKGDRGRWGGSRTVAGMPDRAETLKKLGLIRVLAAIDFAMLVVLVAFLLAGSDAVSPVLGPIHGVLFLGLVYLTAVGASEQRWPWLFPVTTLIPIFALIYDAKLRRELSA